MARPGAALLIHLEVTQQVASKIPFATDLMDKGMSLKRTGETGQSRKSVKAHSELRKQSEKETRDGKQTRHTRGLAQGSLPGRQAPQTDVGHRGPRGGRSRSQAHPGPAPPQERLSLPQRTNFYRKETVNSGYRLQQFSWKHGIWSRRHTPHSRLGSFLPATRDPGPVPVSGESWPGMVPQASGPSLTGVDSHSWGPGSPRGAAVLMRRKGLALSQGCAARKLQADVMKLKSGLTLNGNHPLVTLTGSCSLGPPASQPQNIFFNMKH
ncbi:leucine-rich repeat-containing protein 27 isoform X2 [Manis javanica]|uniref:leucine-rich repeat-containing protein 27 isoform X2 n=1 Tax=Manis javanica TaxID=9974 RepID=UPI003C6D59C3